MRKLKPTERIETRQTLISFYDEVTLQDIQESFDRFIADTNAFPETVILTEISSPGGDSLYAFRGIREETPEERMRRETAERHRRFQAGERKRAKLEQERKEYERLKKKFG